MTFMQRRLNVDATSWRCIDVEATLYKRHVPAGNLDQVIWLAEITSGRGILIYSAWHG